MKMIDAHIHLDQYGDEEIKNMMEESEGIEGVLSVSNDLMSCKRNLHLSKTYQKVYPSFGFHPEQSLPTDHEKSRLVEWMKQHRTEMIAVGEVGLPYYLRQEQKVSKAEYEKYRELLEVFVKLAKKWDKPIVLHAVHDDAPVVCDLLEQYSVTKAHFHWFKGDSQTIHRMMKNGYFVSVTPEIVYKEKIQKLVEDYPLEQMMVETDGPWPFEGPFSGKRTNPSMMRESIRMIAHLKDFSEAVTAQRLFENTKGFFQI